MTTRGQAFTLEAIVASILLVSGLVFALQATAVTPLSASTSSQHIENQQQAVVEGVLTDAGGDGTLRVAALFWDSSAGKFHDASQRYYVDQSPPNSFGDSLRRALGSRQIIVNVNVYYQENGQQIRQRMVYRGEPSDNAISASTTLTLTDQDVIYDATGDPVTVTGESHTYDASVPTDTLDVAPVLEASVGTITDDNGVVYQQGVDFGVVDTSGDGKADTIDWSIGGGNPDDGAAYTVDYTPTVDGSRFFAQDVYPGSGVYNVIEVEVVAWRQ